MKPLPHRQMPMASATPAASQTHSPQHHQDEIPRSGLPGEPPVLTVSELNRMARRALESQIPLLWVEGEISNFTAAVSGHWYFSLKDAHAQVRCVMFRSRNSLAGFTPGNGDHIEVRGLPSLYEARGEFQMGVETLRRAGAGRLYEIFLKLKARLESEGLFDPARKRVLPAFPRRLGIVTSPRAAALHDILTALQRRAPGLPLIIYPTPVQGTGAGTQIAAAIRLAGQRAECDVLLVCRGGGSLEDLWAFNDEAVARAIATSPMPVISGVGHETDFTLADFAADVRAPTPTAAAELASPEWRAQRLHLQRLRTLLARSADRNRNTQMQRLDSLARVLIHPGELLRRQQAHLARLAKRLVHGMQGRHARRIADLHLLGIRFPRCAMVFNRQQQSLALLQARQQRAPRLGLRHQHLDRLASNLDHLNPEKVLARGYSLVIAESGRIVRDAATLAAGDKLSLRFHRGSARSEVTSTTNEE